MRGSDRLAALAFFVGAFAVIMMATLVARRYIGTQNDSVDCLPEVQLTQLGAVVSAIGVVTDEGGVVEFSQSADPREVFTEESDLQGAVWVWQENQLVLGVVTRTHAVDALITCFHKEGPPDYEIIRSREID